MRVLFLVSSLPMKKVGGTEIMTLRICDHLAGLDGFQATIYTIPQSSQETASDSIEECIKRYHLNHLSPDHIYFSEKINDDSPFAYSRANMAYARGLKKRVMDIRPDVIVSMKVQPPEILCRSLVSVARNIRIPYILMVRGFTDICNAPTIERYTGPLSIPERMRDHLYYTRSLPRFIRHASGIVAQTSAQNDHILKQYGVKSEVIFNPIDSEYIRDHLQGISSNRTNTVFSIIYTGSMIPRKNVETLLRAIHLMVEGTMQSGGDDRRRDLKLTLIGGGRGEERIKQLVQELELSSIVKFKGISGPEDIWTEMSAADLFVFPSLSEGFPNVLLEAMACGLPIVSSDFAGIEDIIRSDSNGLIFHKRDHHELAEKVNYFMENEKYRRKVGKENHEYVKQFTWDTFMDRFVPYLKKINNGSST